MASETGSAPDDLKSALEASPFSFGFYQAMRLMEALYPDKPRFGQSRRLRDDPIRISQDPFLEFAPSTLSHTEDKDGALILGQYFFGLFGPNGPLPTHMTEYARDRLMGHRDPTIARFADIFHHRLGMLFYRIWADAEPAVDLCRPEEDRRFASHISALIGLNGESFYERDALSDLAKLFLSGRYASRTKHPEGLLAILLHLFEMPVQMEEFRGEWLVLPKDARCFLGTSLGASRLGQDVVIGESVYECQQKFLLQFGPLDLDSFQSLLPDSGRVERLKAAIRNYLGDEYAWEYGMVLKKEEVPTLKLGEYGQLGWSTWLYHEEREADADDFVHMPRLSPPVNSVRE
ncbi:MAG: type VI secretion system baseplate subunit TssG [Xanthomonadales bacterium]|nr:type VI secretion system baseplate subunit TssG [Xanthomonadales bacterium]